MDSAPNGQGYVMADPGAGDRVVADRYLLHEPVGRGGMGVVWRADDQVLGRTVAVKEVHLQPGLPADEREALQERVMREARAAAMLNHAGAVTVYDVAEDDGQAYIVMELVEAPTLADVVQRDGAQPAEEVARIGLAVLDVLAAAHASGIVHRDLKPGNVLVAGDDSVKLTDFGIAQIKDDPRLTSTGIVLGSPSYISPEQARGEPVTPQTDLWGLGATLFYAACGRPPFDRGEPIATLTSVAHDELTVDPCAGALAPVLTAMLAKDPAQRPGVADLRAMLTAVANGHTVTVPEPPPPANDATQPMPVPAALTGGAPAAVATARRRSWWRVPLVVLLLLAAAGAAALVALNGRGPGGPGAAEPRDVPGVTFTTYTHPSQGWTVHYPRGWNIQPRSASAVDFREPGTGRYLRVGFTASPGDDAKAAWESGARAFASDHGGYEQIRIDDADYRGYEAAIWEYRWRDTNLLHAVNLGFVTGGKGYALNFQTREQDWERSQDLFEAMKERFEPAG